MSRRYNGHRLVATGAPATLRAACTSMLVPATVTIVINGSIVSGSLPARLSGGRVISPLTPPVVARLGSRVVYDSVRRTVTIERQGQQIVVPVILYASGEPYIEIGRVANGLGGSATFDARSKTLAIVLSESVPIATPTAFRGTYTPGAVNPLGTSRALPVPSRTDGGAMPQPRRTAIPAQPSQPIPSPAKRLA